MPATQACSSAQPFALTWAAFQCHILVPTRDGCAFATVPCTTSSEESDRVQPKQTCHTSTTPYMVLWFASKSNSSPTSHPALTTYDHVSKGPICLTFIDLCITYLFKTCLQLNDKCMASICTWIFPYLSYQVEDGFYYKIFRFRTALIF